MEVTGRLDEHGRAWLPITVRGNRGEATIEAVIDLGFTETMALPIEIAAPLGLELTSSIPLELADGRLQTFFLFAATIVFGELEIPGDIIGTERGAPLMARRFCRRWKDTFPSASPMARFPFQSRLRKPPAFVPDFRSEVNEDGGIAEVEHPAN